MNEEWHVIRLIREKTTDEKYLQHPNSMLNDIMDLLDDHDRQRDELAALRQQVDVCTKALEKAEKYISGTGQWFSEREKTPVLWQVRQALAAVKAAGGQGE